MIIGIIREFERNVDYVPTPHVEAAFEAFTQVIMSAQKNEQWSYKYSYLAPDEFN